MGLAFNTQNTFRSWVIFLIIRSILISISIEYFPHSALSITTHRGREAPVTVSMTSEQTNYPKAGCGQKVDLCL
jgi:hypothetical protein